MLHKDDYKHLHDANLSSLAVQDDELRIGISESREWTLLVTGVAYLVCAPFLMGNIIQDIRVLPFAELDLNDCRVSQELRAAFFDTYGPLPDAPAFSEHLLLEITSSYGCEMLALFKGEVKLICVE